MCKTDQCCWRFAAIRVIFESWVVGTWTLFFGIWKIIKNKRTKVQGPDVSALKYIVAARWIVGKSSVKYLLQLTGEGIISSFNVSKKCHIIITKLLLPSEPQPASINLSKIRISGSETAVFLLSPLALLLSHSLNASHSCSLHANAPILHFGCHWLSHWRSSGLIDHLLGRTRPRFWSSCSSLREGFRRITDKCCLSPRRRSKNSLRDLPVRPEKWVTPASRLHVRCSVSFESRLQREFPRLWRPPRRRRLGFTTCLDLSASRRSELWLPPRPGTAPRTRLVSSWNVKNVQCVSAHCNAL